MTNYNAVMCSLEPKQVVEYIKGNKDTELRKKSPNPKRKTGKDIHQIPVIIGVIGSDIGFIKGKVDKVVRKRADKAWELSKKYQFGITEDKYWNYYDEDDEAVLVHFSSIELILPPLNDLPGTVGWRYLSLDDLPTEELDDVDEEIKSELITKTKEIGEKEASTYNPEFNLI